MTQVRDLFGTGIVDGHDYVGIEVELENCLQLPERIKGWTMTDDGSLQNHGKEFVSKPLQLGEVEGALRALQAVIDSNGYAASFRCGVHIHWNVGHWNAAQMWKFYLTYLSYENLIYRYVTDARAQSVFCTPVQSTEFPAKLLSDARGGVPSLEHFLRRSTKYSGLNLLPIAQHGTMEFRHLGGTDRLEEIREWIQIITNLVHLSQEISIEQLTAINTTSEYVQWIDRVFPKGSLDGNEQYLSKLLRIGVRYVKQIL